MINLIDITMKSLLYAVLILTASHLKAQVTAVDYVLVYDPSSCLYNACVVMAEGTLTGQSLESQMANVQLSVVVPDGVEITIDSVMSPIGTAGPVEWTVSAVISPPQSTTTNRYYSFVPVLSTASFPGFEIGDTIPMFGMRLTPNNNCGEDIRLWDDELDPSPAQLPLGQDFGNGFSLAIPFLQQLYRANLPTVLSNPEIEVNLLECEGEIVIDLVPVTNGCAGDYNYDWSGPGGFTSSVTDTGIDLAISPASDEDYGLYSVVVSDARNCLDTVEVDLTYPTASIDDASLCVGASTQAQPSSGGIWTSSDETVATISNAGSVVTIGAGTCTFTYTDLITGCESVPALTLTLTVLPAPVIEVFEDELCLGDPIYQ